jgi:polyphenol oxidase
MSTREPAVGHAELRHELPGGAVVLFTDRSNGSFTLPPDPGEGAVAAEQRERVLELTGVAELARGRQVHGSTVLRVSAARADLAELPLADGQATSVSGLAVMVVSADCLPVALAGEGAVAMLHCGWRGLAAGVLEEGIQAVRELAGIGPLSAVIGPGAGPCCYEVGPEVHEALAVRRENALLGLSSVARSRLLAAGVQEVETVQLCTICDSRFYSHRREGAAAGRQAGIAWLS